MDQGDDESEMASLSSSEYRRAAKKAKKKAKKTAKKANNDKKASQAFKSEQETLSYMRVYRWKGRCRMEAERQEADVAPARKEMAMEDRRGNRLRDFMAGDGVASNQYAGGRLLNYR